MPKATDPFPMDFNEFMRDWREWYGARKEEFQPSSWRWPAKNIMADEVLIQKDRNEQHIELSTGVFFDARFIGITFSDGVRGRWTPENPTVHSWVELEKELGIGG